MTATTAGKKTASQSQTVVVRKPDEHVVMTEVPTIGGVIPGKVIVNGTNVSFTAASYDITSKTIGETNLVALVTGKLGKGAVTGGITVVASGASGSFAGAEMTLCRNVWKDKGAEPAPADVQGLYTVKLGADERGTGYLSLTVDKKGSVKVAGKAPDGTALSASATLMLPGTAAAPYFADVFCAPSAYKGGYVAGRLSWDVAGRVSSDGLDWTSFNPQSTGVWKGTLLWDFGDPSLKPVKVPFEGVMVQGEDLDGFGTYDISASYIPYDKTGKPQNEKTYKVKESLPVKFIDSNKDL